MTNVVVIIDAVKFIMEKYHTEKEKLESSQKEGEEEEENSKSKEPDYNEDTEGEEKQ